jgi:hypothetical protein
MFRLYQPKKINVCAARRSPFPDKKRLAFQQALGALESYATGGLGLRLFANDF